MESMLSQATDWVLRGVRPTEVQPPLQSSPSTEPLPGPHCRVQKGELSPPRNLTWAEVSKEPLSDLPSNLGRGVTGVFDDRHTCN